MTTTRRNVMWPVIVIAVGGIWLLMIAGVFPDAVGDILERAWPALLILFGFDVLAGQRRLYVGERAVPLSAIGLVILLIFLAGVIWFAYRQQGDKLRTDTQKTFSEILPDDVERVRIEVTLQRTTVTIDPVQNTARMVKAAFMGSKESDVVMDWSVEGRQGVLVINERYQSSIPKLTDFGRGTLSLVLPVDVPVELLDLSSAEGDILVNLRPVLIDQLALRAENGDLTVALPDQTALTGELRVDSGDLTLDVPVSVPLTLSLGSGSNDPNYDYDRDRYDLLRDGQLKLRNSEAFQVGLTVWMNGGATLTVHDVP